MSNRVTKKQTGGGSGNTTQVYDLSSQCDGVLMTFTLPANYTAMDLTSTQFPETFRPIVDFTSVAGSVTIDPSIPPIQAGQTLLALCTVTP